MPNHIKVFLTSLILFLSACAQVPKEAIELSATVGRDLAEIRKSHIALVDLYYQRLFDDINNFIDDIYLPFQVQNTLSDAEIKKDLLDSIEKASRENESGSAQKEALEKIQIYLLEVTSEVESFRKERLKPVKEQYSILLKNINQAYDQIHYANSIVTGHLASVRKVHDTQDEILSKLDLNNFRTTLGKGLSELSDEIGNLTKLAKEKNQNIDEIINKFKELINAKKQ
ncbi:MAG: hypothetical protein AB1432_04955 [Bacteroidota bacterium]